MRDSGVLVVVSLLVSLMLDFSTAAPQFNGYGYNRGYNPVYNPGFNLHSAASVPVAQQSHPYQQSQLQHQHLQQTHLQQQHLQPQQLQPLQQHLQVYPLQPVHLQAHPQPLQQMQPLQTLQYTHQQQQQPLQQTHSVHQQRTHQPQQQTHQPQQQKHQPQQQTHQPQQQTHQPQQQTHQPQQQGHQQSQQKSLQQEQQQLQSAQSVRSSNAYLPPPTTPQPTIIHKQFYVIAGPQDVDSVDRSKHLVIGRPQKNYRVIFIKAPSAHNENLKLSAEFAPQEEKTVIYVLTKKDHDLTVNDIATPAPTQPSKPEVYFIKYKTPEEAEAARKEIQDKYDELGGTNEYNEEVSAPITSIVGALEGGSSEDGYNYRQIEGAQSSALSDYLPPLTKK